MRHRYDLSSLELVVHAAAPCPPEVKRAAIEWLGPIVHEFYSGSEGSGFCAIGPEEWLDHPGSVGRSLMGAVHIVGEDGEDVPAGEEGQVWFESATRFEYHGDPAKTATAWNDRGWSTMGDIGRLDADGYLYLTDRVANTIISGGVNIYPREAEDVLILHPAVHDVGVVGVPDDEMGERVVAFVQPEPGTGRGRRPRRRARRLVPGAADPLQVPDRGPLPRRAAPAAHRQAAQARAGAMIPGMESTPAGSAGPRIVHVDDVPWQEVRRQQHGPDPTRTASATSSAGRAPTSRSTRATTLAPSSPGRRASTCSR